MGRPVRRPPKISRPSASVAARVRWRLLLFLGAAVLVVSPVAVIVGLELQGEIRRNLQGTTDRISYALVQTGQTQAQVFDLLGSAPRAVEAAPLGLDAPLGLGAPLCYVYDRRSGRPGHYRFCFQGGLMVSKSRIDWPT